MGFSWKDQRELFSAGPYSQFGAFRAVPKRGLYLGLGIACLFFSGRGLTPLFFSRTWGILFALSRFLLRIGIGLRWFRYVVI